LMALLVSGCSVAVKTKKATNGRLSIVLINLD